MAESDQGSDPSSHKIFARLRKSIWRFLQRRDPDSDLRETIEELIEESRENDGSSIASDERELLGNVLNLQDLTAEDVMTPRADIVAAPVTISIQDLATIMIRSGRNRVPIYKDNLDHVLGAVHIRDLLAQINKSQTKKESSEKVKADIVKHLIHPVLFVSPAMRTLDLLFEMRESGVKMALVVDEYGGVDGLVTFANLIEEIIGDIQDAQDTSHPSQFFRRSDGTIIVDGRMDLEDVEEELKLDLMLPEHEDEIDTLGGLVISILGRVPNRGEIVPHPRGIEFEVIDADPRRIKRLCIHNIERYK